MSIQMYTIDVQKRGFVLSHYKFIFLAHLLDGQQKLKTHTFGHNPVDVKHFLDPEQPATGKTIIFVVCFNQNKRYKAQLTWKHARVVNKARALWPDNGDDADSKLNGD